MKITLPYLFLVLVFSFGVAVLASQIVLETVDERFTNQLYEAGKIAAESVVGEETQTLATLRLLANMDGVADALERGDAEQLRTLSLGTVINSQEESVEFLSADRMLVLSLRHKNGGQIEEYDSSQGGDAFANFDIVQKVSANQVDALGDKYADNVHTAWGDYFYIAGPVYNQQRKFVGSILIGKPLISLARQIREETLAQVTLYDFNGQPLASTFSKPAALDPATAALVLEQQASSSYRRNSNRRDFDTLDLSYGEILGPWEVRGDTDLGILGVSLVKNKLIIASLPTRIQIIGLTTLMVFFILLVGINIATLITQPLVSLARASRIAASGNLDVQVPVSTRDEIADLANSFNQMIESLQRSKLDLIDSYNKTLHGWSKALELRDDDTSGHSMRVTELTVNLGRKLGLDEEELDHIYRGALLHDIGKMGIPDSILLKNGKLTAEEWQQMYQHPQYAMDMLAHIPYLKPALAIPYCHHERWDGSGYPQGLKGEDIPLAARLFALADVWDALTSDRPYRRHLEPLDAMSVIVEGSGSLFEPRLVTLFVEYAMEQHLLGERPQDLDALDDLQTLITDRILDQK